MKLRTICALGLAIALGNATAGFAAEVDVKGLAKTIRSIGPKGAGYKAATKAMQELAKADSNQLKDILGEMKGAGPVAMNWMRAAVDAIVDREQNAKRQLPINDLESFLSDQSNAPRARRTAYEVLLQLNPKAESKWIPKMLNDTSLELRRDAVAQTLGDAQKALDTGDNQGATQLFKKAFSASRDVDQIKSAAEQLGKLKTTVDLPKHFGFVMNWNLIGPFDNTNKSGFDVAYPPEKTIDLTATYKGKSGDIKWIPHTTKDSFGTVDLNKALDKHKGAICYAYSEFHAGQAREIEIRMGCINGNKVWLNGELLTRNHVYHANIDIDQYIARGKLRKGRNTILVKVAQNEQEESWAQRWQFQLRVCDAIGTAVLSQK